MKMYVGFTPVALKVLAKLELKRDEDFLSLLSTFPHDSPDRRFRPCITVLSYKALKDPYRRVALLLPYRLVFLEPGINEGNNSFGFD